VNNAVDKMWSEGAIAYADISWGLKKTTGKLQ